ncbi:hypothetical protein LINPERPRIM_LOCUS22381, partial [Linum perenne]
MAISRVGAQFQMMVDSLERATIMCMHKGNVDDDMGHVLRAGLAASGGYERLPDRGPHAPRWASHEQTYTPYEGYPIPQRGHFTRLDPV